MRPNFRITPETPSDYHEVEQLFDLSFAPGRTALSSYRLRDGVDPVPGLSVVARDDYDVLAGAVRFWPVEIVDGQTARAALLLGPIAVHPTRQGEGLGAALMGNSLDRAAEAGWRRVLLVGDAPYYGRFGFSRVPVRFPPPTNPERVLARSLRRDEDISGLTGEVRTWSGTLSPSD